VSELKGMNEDYEHFEVLQLGHFQAKREFRRSYNPPWIFEAIPINHL
jgi:hypothetical protein